MRKLHGRTLIGGISAIDLNVVCWQDRGIDEDVLSYCFQRLAFAKRKPSSIEEETYILLEWVNWLASRGKRLEDASRTDYLFWNTDRRSAEEVSIARLHRKHEVVWNFYLHLRSNPKLRIKTAGFFASISDRSVSTNRSETWTMKLQRERSSRVRKPRVPTDSEANLVLEKLGEHPNPFIAERNFLIGQIEARVGLRAMGVEGLTISALDSMLEAEGICTFGGSIESLASDDDEQARIRRALRELREKNRSVLEMSVVEKGGKERKVEVPIDLVRRLLDHVWGRRAALIRRRRIGGRPNRSFLFISSKTALPMTRGAIKDLVKHAFSQARVKGSGHALRAYYLTTKAVELIREAKRRFGRNYSIEDIYTELAQIAGHKHRATLFAYIDVARLWAAALDVDD